MAARQLRMDFTRSDGLVQHVTLDPGETLLLGRDLTCDCRLEGRKVSRRHFSLIMDPAGAVRVEDHGSHNGTFVNGVRISERALQGGEMLSVGEWEGRVNFADEAPRKRTVPGVMPAVSGSLSQPLAAPPNVAPPNIVVPNLPPSIANSNPLPRATSAAGDFDIVTDPSVRAPQTPPPPDPNERRTHGAEANAPVDTTKLIDMTQVWQWQEAEEEKSQVSEDALRAAPVEKNPIVRALTIGVGQQLDFRGLRELEQEKERAVTPGANFNVDAVALRLAFKVMESLQATVSMNAFLEDMCDSLLSAARAKAVVVLLPDDNDQLMPTTIKNRRQDEAVHLSRTVIDHAVRTRSAITTEDASADERFASGESVLRFDLKAVLCVPLVRENQVIGAVYLTRDLPFTETEIDLVAALTHMIAVGLERARLRDQIAREAQTRQALERFHAPDVVRRLMMESNGGHDRSGLFLETLTSTILFCDLSGFTTFCEANPPEVVGNLLNDYLGHMTEIVFEHGGTVDKYIGDAIMCIFGAPFMTEDDAIRGVRCAVAMREAFTLMKAEGRFDHAKGTENMHVHIGVNTGSVVAGTVGSSKRMEYTALGDTVNLAARLEGKAGPGQIVIGPTTAELVKGMFDLQTMGNVDIKGKALQVEVFEVR